MDPKLGELPGTDVLIDGGKIAAIGKDLAAADADEIAADNMILMPGMVNGNTHLWLTVDAGAVVKTDYSEWLGFSDWKKRIICHLRPEDHYLSCLIGGLQSVDAGVTTVVDSPHAQYTPEQAEAACRGAIDSGVGGWCAFQLGVNVDYGPGDVIHRSEADRKYISLPNETHWSIAKMLQETVFTDSSAPLQFSLAAAALPGLDMAGVKAQFERIRATGVQCIEAGIVFRPRTAPPPGTFMSRGSGIYDLHDAGLLGPDLHITHGAELDDAELALMLDHGVMTCSTVMGEIMYIAGGHGASIHGRAREAGIAAGIGTDVPLSVTQDYFEHVRAALWGLYIEPASRKIVTRYTPTDALDFATRLGARAVGLGDVTGTITVGKRADLVLLRTDRIGFAMRGGLADRVVTFGALQDIDSVWVMGRLRKRHGKMIGVDWADLKGKLAQAQARFIPLAERMRIVD